MQIPAPSNEFSPPTLTVRLDCIVPKEQASMPTGTCGTTKLIWYSPTYPATRPENICHRNLNLGDSQCVFISTRLMDDKFSVAFEFYINVGHALVERAGVSRDFSELAWSQVEAGVRGETSLDAWEARKLATAGGPDAERFKNEYLDATFSDTISIYLLSLYLDVDYYDLRERDYPLLAPSALAERLRKVAALFPANAGYEFAVLYKRRG